MYVRVNSLNTYRFLANEAIRFPKFMNNFQKLIMQTFETINYYSKKYNFLLSKYKKKGSLLFIFLSYV